MGGLQLCYEISFKGFTHLLPLAFEYPHFSGLGAFRLLQLSSRIRLRETLECFIDMKMVLGLHAISCIPHRVKASYSSIKDLDYAHYGYIRVLRKKNIVFSVLKKNN